MQGAGVHAGKRSRSVATLSRGRKTILRCLATVDNVARYISEGYRMITMNPGAGAGWLSSGVPEIGTNGTTKG